MTYISRGKKSVRASQRYPASSRSTFSTSSMDFTTTVHEATVFSQPGSSSIDCMPNSSHVQTIEVTPEVVHHKSIRDDDRSFIFLACHLFLAKLSFRLEFSRQIREENRETGKLLHHLVKANLGILCHHVDMFSATFQLLVSPEDGTIDHPSVLPQVTLKEWEYFYDFLTHR